MGHGPSVTELDAFSLVFASTLAGLGIRLVFERWRGLSVLPVLASLLACLSLAGVVFAQDVSWKSNSRFVAAMARIVHRGDSAYLVAQPAVAQYYLDGLTLPRQFVSTAVFTYTPPAGKEAVSGRPAYTAALQHGYFGIVALPVGSSSITNVNFIRSALWRSHKYKLLVHLPPTPYEQGWDIWVAVTSAGS